ncbi:MAG TPA: hypothetical protein VF190_09540, partial [Rhodothermales bacterium]
QAMITCRALGLLIAALVLTDAVQAQTPAGDEELMLQQAEQAIMEITPEEATSLILGRLMESDRTALDRYLMLGAITGQNLVIIRQKGDANVAATTQIGQSNLAVLHQEGTGNVTLLQQIGDGNVFGSWLIGDYNSLSLLQEGNDNVYLLEYLGSNRDFGHVVQQVGSGIQAVQVGVRDRAFGIEQRGNGMELRIEHLGP